MERHEDAVDESTTLGSVARTLQAEPDVDSTLMAIVKAAVSHIVGADYAGISLIEGRHRIRTVAPTDDLVTTIDAVQYRTGQGPCLDAIAEHQVLRTGDLAAEHRWPAFSPEAASIGVRSMLSYRLFVTDATLGSLNLYARARDAFSDQADGNGELFATHAAVALASAQREAALHAALQNRDVIGTAKGILMARHRIDAPAAFRMLVDCSQHSNIKLHQVAAWLVEHHRTL